MSALVSHQSDILESRSELVTAGVYAAGGHGRLCRLSSLSMLATSQSSASASDVVLAVSNIAKYQVFLKSL